MKIAIIGTGISGLSIFRLLAETIKQIVSYMGDLYFNSSKPDGTKRKLIDVSRLANMGWVYSVDLEDGLQQTYNWYKNNE